MKRLPGVEALGSDSCAPGFTVVELVIVMLVIGILSAVAISRFARQQPYDSMEFLNAVQSLASFARSTAVAQRRDVYLQLTSSHAGLCWDASCSSPVAPPAGISGVTGCGDALWFCSKTPSEISISPTVTLDFTPSGALSPPTAVTITISGGDSPQSLIVEGDTGYVHGS
ncbi:MAG: GspH/FimT family pseudopilin [Pseudomonadota bacterium]|nr:GspH/FimT family pseudopilin [Pseudomonadota bacterium]